MDTLFKHCLLRSTGFVSVAVGLSAVSGDLLSEIAPSSTVE